MLFDVTALNAEQDLVQLELEAFDREAAARQLLGQGLHPVTIHPAKSLNVARRTRFPIRQFAQELRALLAAGLNVLESLDVLLDRNSSAIQREVLTALIQSLREGHRFSSSLARQPHVFPSLFIGILRAAEGSSELPLALERFLSHEDRLERVKKKIISAAIYPSILIVVGGGVALFLTTYVVPRFAALYQSGGQSLPVGSRLLLEWGNFASANARWLLTLCGLGMLLLATWVQRNYRDGNWLRALAALPGARKKIEVLDISRLYLTLGVLLKGGLPVTLAMQLARDVLPPDRRGALARASASIAEGEPLSDALSVVGLTVPVSHRLLKVGERSGQMAEMLIRGGEYHEEEISLWIERFTKVFEPVLMAVIGIVVGIIVVLLYMPIFDLAGAVQ